MFESFNVFDFFAGILFIMICELLWNKSFVTENTFKKMMESKKLNLWAFSFILFFSSKSLFDVNFDQGLPVFLILNIGFSLVVILKLIINDKIKISN